MPSVDRIYFISWLDCLERLDVILMEARHLQQSIIHLLREPVFYVPLRHEEFHIWGSGWAKEFARIPNRSTAADEELARKWMLGYPSPEESIEQVRNGNTDPNEVLRRVKFRLERIWIAGGWGRDQRRHYHYLRGIQSLKQHVLTDKITLCRYALRLRLHDQKQTEPDVFAKARFLVLRRGVLKRTSGYLDRLRDHKNQVNKALDSGAQDHPRPMIERRRELGVYLDFLSERARDIQRDMCLLVARFYGEQPYETKRRIVLHGWAHDWRSSFHEVTDNEPQLTFGGRAEPLFGYINTHFWMPERPDLQPVLAHEIAHAVIKTHIGDLVDIQLKPNTNPFAVLLGQIYQTINDFGNQSGIPELRNDSYGVLLEIASDLLATAVKGAAYVHALFLEIVGFGLEDLLRVEKGRIDLQMVDWITPSGDALFRGRRDWYFRLRVVVRWLRKIHHMARGKDKPAIDEQLLGGIESVLEELLDFIDRTTPDTEVRTGPFWRLFASRLCHLTESSTAAIDVHKWRTERSRDDTNEETHEKGPRILPRSMRRLHPKLRQHLLLVQLRLKREHGRCLSDAQDDELLDQLQTRYGLSKAYWLQREALPPKSNWDPMLPIPPRELYRHLYDIPWQATIMRATDLLWYAKKTQSPTAQENRDQELLNWIHWDFPLGRELFGLALEFFLHDTESARIRLSTAINIAEGLDKQIAQGLTASTYGSAEGQLQRDINHWRLGKATTKTSITTLSKDVGAQHSCMGCIFGKHKDLGAETFNWLFSDVDARDMQGRQRNAESLAGRKVQELFSILNDFSNNHNNSPLRRSLIAYTEYLKVRDETHKEEDPTLPTPFGDFHSRVLNSLCPETSKSDKKGTISDGRSLDVPLRFIPTYLLGRISMAGSYGPTARDANFGTDTNAYSLDEVFGSKERDFVFKHENTYYLENENTNQRQFYKPVLGRYDTIVFSRTRMLSRDIQPFFPSSSVTSPPPELRDCPGEIFSTFFLRREMATLAQLKTVPDFLNQRLLACIAIVLQRRSYRLDFLYRLLRSTMQPIEGRKSCRTGESGRKPFREPIFLEEAAQYLGPNDAAFLTDGWGDLLLLIFCNPSANDTVERISQIFCIQDALFADFMVDRTELLFTPICADIVANNPLSGEHSDPGDFQTQVQIRLMEDRFLQPSNRMFVDNLEAQLGDGRNLEKIGAGRYYLTKVPGRMDFYLRFTPRVRPQGDGSRGGLSHVPFYDNLMEIMREASGGMLDRVDTRIGLIEAGTNHGDFPQGNENP